MIERQSQDGKAAGIRSKLSLKMVVFLLIAMLFIYAVLPQLKSFKSSLHLFGHLDWRDLLIALFFSLLTYLFAAGIYVVITFNKLSFLKTISIQMAGMFVNRLVPAGIGNIGVNFDYLRKCNHTKSQAAAIVGINNLLGVVGHLLLVGVLVGLDPSVLHLVRFPHITVLDLLPFLAMVVLGLVLFWARRLPRKFLKEVRLFFKQVGLYRYRRKQLAGGLLFSICLTLAYCLCLIYSAHSVGLSLPLVRAILAISVGLIIGTAVPTPGGVGSTDLGIFSALLALGMSSTNALATTLVYRLITYWLALLIGGAVFGYAESAGYL